MSNATDTFHRRVTPAGALVATGIVFGDLGASPLYTYNAVFHGRIITESAALGSLSCVFWTLFLLTTVKYVIITLGADNKGEGGILSLYALIRKYFGSWVVFPAMAGAAFLFADGIVTPPISVASAVEGIEGLVPGLDTVPITIALLVGLFLFQQFGSHNIGRIYGPVMMVWFAFIAAIGLYALKDNLSVFRGLNPYYAYTLVVKEPGGFWLLGGIFLCATGAEALYSDMGHAGRNNIRVSWACIKVCLIACYAGQSAWLLEHVGQRPGAISPFYHIVPQSLFWIGLSIATAATIIASQSLISGCFTLVNEAIRMDLWPQQKVLFPGSIKGQLYIPAVNWFLMCGCIAMVLHFRQSTRMEAAFGLSVTLTMLISTILVSLYLRTRGFAMVWTVLVGVFFFCIESAFLLANLTKFTDGGWITLLIGLTLFSMMFLWHKGQKIQRGLTREVSLDDFAPVLSQLSADELIPKYATNLVYFTTAKQPRRVEYHLLDSILHYARPKRADNYWFVYVNILDEPYGSSYCVDIIKENDLYVVGFNLGFKTEPRIDYYFRQVVRELIKEEEVDVKERSEYSYQRSSIGDFVFVVRQSFLSYDNDVPLWSNFIMRSFYNLRHLSVKVQVSLGLDKSHVVIEEYPLVLGPAAHSRLIRQEPESDKGKH